MLAQIEGQFVRPDTTVEFGILSFGKAVGISGDQALIASSLPNVNSVWIMQQAGDVWGQEGEILALQEQVSQVFGHSLAVDGDAAVVGGLSYSYNGATNGGIAYAYQRSGDSWAGVATLTPDDIQGQDEFGISVGIDGDLIIAGSHKDDDRATDAGAAYIFRQNGGSWIQEAKLHPTDSTENVRLGWSVSVSGDYAIAGAPFELNGIGIQGTAYIFERTSENEWAQAARLDAINPSLAEGFGWDVVINGDVAMVGANGAHGTNSEDGSIPGAVYVYNRIEGVWTFMQKLLASDGASSDQFGGSVDFEGNCAVIGAFNGEKAYLFKNNGTMWQEAAILTSTLDETNTGYGFDVSTSGGNVIVGTLGLFIPEMGGGGAYLYNNLCNSVATASEPASPVQPAFKLHQNYPNPFAASTTIQYKVARPADVRITVYNLLGQEVARLREGTHGSGTYLVTWDNNELASGMYLYTMDVDGVRMATRRMIIR